VTGARPRDNTAPAAATSNRLLKRDLFGTVTLEQRPNEPARVVRDVAAARWWARPLARALARREARALQCVAGTAQVPRLIECSRDRLVRDWIEAVPMQQARPRDAAYYRDALRLVRRLHAQNVVHNDLAKEPNWLVTPQGSPAIVDFQLAWVSRRRPRLFRALAHDDLRHLLKHKRSYLPERLTARQRRILETRSWVSQLWMRTAKPVYRFITRRLLGWADREGAGDRAI
jgi:RIO-like serine/threonine protein kinase